MKKTKNFRGRPRKYVSGISPSCTIRLSNDVYRRVRAAAKKVKGRSISEEITRRVEKTFFDDDLIKRILDAVKNPAATGLERET